jgi:hypothetical protein
MVGGEMGAGSLRLAVSVNLSNGSALRMRSVFLKADRDDEMNEWGRGAWLAGILPPGQPAETRPVDDLDTELLLKQTVMP